MSTIIIDMISFFETQIAVILPSSFSKLNFVYEPSREAKKGADNGYGVVPQAASQNDLNLSSYALDQDFKVTLTKVYKSSRLQNDTDIQTNVITLQDYCHDIFKQFKQSAPADTVIRHILNLNIDEPVLDEESHLIIQSFTITVKYQNSLT